MSRVPKSYSRKSSGLRRVRGLTPDVFEPEAEVLPQEESLTVTIDLGSEDPSRVYEVVRDALGSYNEPLSLRTKEVDLGEEILPQDEPAAISEPSPSNQEQEAPVVQIKWDASMRKAELSAVAAVLGHEITDDMTKAQIIALLKGDN